MGGCGAPRTLALVFCAHGQGRRPRRGHLARAVQEREHRSAWGLEDRDQLAIAVRDQRAFVTSNLWDFVPISREWVEVGRAHLGIVLVHPRTVPIGALGELVWRLAALLRAYPGDHALRDRIVFL